MNTPATAVNYLFCSQTDRGRVRGNNEDAVAFDQATGIGVLADGMGGYNAGEVASGMATSIIVGELRQWLIEMGPVAHPRDIRPVMELCIEHANRAILEAAQTEAQFAGMGTTLVVAVFQSHRLLLGHIGDSRCYRFRRGHLQQLTKDHSLLQEQLDAGLLTPRQAAASAQRNLLTRALGVETLMLPEVNEYEVAPGDVYLLCSDGLHDMLRGPDIAKILALNVPLEQQAQRLTDAANAQGGRDNITVMLAKSQAPANERKFVTRWLEKLRLVAPNN